MAPPVRVNYHEGLTELLHMKRAMLGTICRYGVVGLGIAFLLAFFVVMTHSWYWADLLDFLRAVTR
ncbi:MAG TPA: hypothetical protein P5186_21550 [Candidatus Paceibacterota bacterium]|nr:hypothetical protein [Verrucomicrobiota bacterium]HRY50645.1 hypothetical protein [Candidatus Paceibacterota bacterium]HSA00765.1 hypothetical protein [Candidatus Paceibacterota bacterium]